MNSINDGNGDNKFVITVAPQKWMGFIIRRRRPIVRWKKCNPVRKKKRQL